MRIMEGTESNGAKIILPLIGIVFLLIVLWVAWTVTREPGEPASLDTIETVEQKSLAAIGEAAPPLDEGTAELPEAVQEASYPDEHIFTALTSDTLIPIMTALGYDVEKDDEDVKWRLQGRRCLLLLYDDGHALQFYIGVAGGKASLAALNDWNKNRRFSRTYRDDDDDPCLELDLDLAGGVTLARLKDFFQTCDTSLSRWYQEIIR